MTKKLCIYIYIFVIDDKKIVGPFGGKIHSLPSSSCILLLSITVVTMVIYCRDVLDVPFHEPGKKNKRYVCTNTNITAENTRDVDIIYSRSQAFSRFIDLVEEAC